MTRVVIFFLIVAALAAIAVWIADEPGQVAISWGDGLVETSPAALAAAAAIFAASGALLFQLARWLWVGPRTIARARHLRRQRRGYVALTQGLVSAAAGDPRGARRLARRANLLLGEPPLTLLLSAQAAQLEGEDDLAKAYFEAMLEQPETEFLGLRGLLVQANKAGDNLAALSLAERAFALRPHTPWVLTTLLELQSHAGRWSDALGTLRVALRQKALEAEAGQRREAGLLLEQARAARDAGEFRPLPFGKARALRHGVERKESTVIFEDVAGCCLTDPTAEIDLGERLPDSGESGCNDVHDGLLLTRSPNRLTRPGRRSPSGRGGCP